MRSLKLIALAALVSTTTAAPAMARDNCATHRCYHRGPVGAAVGTAGAIAGGPNGFACEPGTWFRGPDGRRHLCR